VLIVEHDRTAETVGVHCTTVDDVQVEVIPGIQQGLAKGHVSSDVPKREIENRSQFQLLTRNDRKIPADTTGSSKTVPFYRDLALLFALSSNEVWIVS